MRDVKKLLKRAQEIFNRYIRARDAHLGCISCRNGAVENAGHYYSQGNHSRLRFDEFNVNGQCIACNMHKHGNLIEYHKGLNRKYGHDRILLLDAGCRGVKKWSEAELLAIIQDFTDKYNNLKRS